MSAEYIAQVTFQDVSNLSKDRFENSWHFTGDGTNGANDVVEIIHRLSDFYNGSVATADNVSRYLATSINGTATVKVYLESDPTPRVVRGEGSFVLGGQPSASQDLPESASVVLSYYSVSNTPRNRGRVFLGPLNSQALEMDTNPRPAAAFLNALKLGAMRLLVNGDGAVPLGPVLGYDLHGSGLGWSALASVTFPIAASESTTSSTTWAQRSSLGAGTYSAKSKTGTKIVTYSEVTAGFISNAWHQQRRREVEATARVLFP